MQLELRELARSRRIGAAIEAFKRADECYWAVVVGWMAFILGRANRREDRMRLPRGELHGLYMEIGYMTALRLVPDQSAFGTYFAQWERSMLPRNPEGMTLVHLATFQGLSARVRTLSLDAPRTKQRDDAASLLDEFEGTPDDLDRLDRSDIIATVRPGLTPAQRKLFDALRREDNLAKIGEKFGVSREAVRVRRNALIQRARELAPGIAGP